MRNGDQNLLIINVTQFGFISHLNTFGNTQFIRSIAFMNDSFCIRKNQSERIN